MISRMELILFVLVAMYRKSVVPCNLAKYSKCSNDLLQNVFSAVHCYIRLYYMFCLYYNEQECSCRCIVQTCKIIVYRGPKITPDSNTCTLQGFIQYFLPGGGIRLDETAQSVMGA